MLPSGRVHQPVPTVRSMIRLILMLALTASAGPGTSGTLVTMGESCSYSGMPARVITWTSGCGKQEHTTIRTARHGDVDLDSLLDALAPKPGDSVDVISVHKGDGPWRGDSFLIVRVKR